jgi:PhnB protein
VEQAQRAPADGGTITTPPQPNSWAKTWGMLADRFGTSWIVNGERVPF